MVQIIGVYVVSVDNGSPSKLLYTTDQYRQSAIQTRDVVDIFYERHYFSFLILPMRSHKVGVSIKKSFRSLENKEKRLCSPYKP